MGDNATYYDCKRCEPGTSKGHFSLADIATGKLLRWPTGPLREGRGIALTGNGDAGIAASVGTNGHNLHTPHPRGSDDNDSRATAHVPNIRRVRVCAYVDAGAVCCPWV